MLLGDSVFCKWPYMPLPTVTNSRISYKKIPLLKCFWNQLSTSEVLHHRSNLLWLRRWLEIPQILTSLFNRNTDFESVTAPTCNALHRLRFYLWGNSTVSTHLPVSFKRQLNERLLCCCGQGVYGWRPFVSWSAPSAMRPRNRIERTRRFHFHPSGGGGGRGGGESSALSGAKCGRNRPFFLSSRMFRCQWTCVYLYQVLPHRQRQWSSSSSTCKALGQSSGQVVEALGQSSVPRGKLQTIREECSRLFRLWPITMPWPIDTSWSTNSLVFEFIYS